MLYSFSDRILAFRLAFQKVHLFHPVCDITNMLKYSQWLDQLDFCLCDQYGVYIIRPVLCSAYLYSLAVFDPQFCRSLLIFFCSGFHLHHIGEFGSNLSLLSQYIDEFILLVVNGLTKIVTTVLEHITGRFQETLE